MRLICISDLHGRSGKIEGLRDVSADLIVVSGDITDFGGKDRARAILEDLLKINNVVGVPGNCDRLDVNEALVEAEADLHSRGRVLGGIGFFGVGGSNATPFHTPQEYSEEEIEAFLVRAYEEVKDREVKVLVSHAPPYNTKVDETSAGRHAGSTKVREFVERHQPNLVICGHIHEAKGVDKIGESVIINAGPLHMGYVTVNIGKKIDFEFVGF